MQFLAKALLVAIVMLSMVFLPALVLEVYLNLLEDFRTNRIEFFDNLAITMGATVAAIFALSILIRYTSQKDDDYEDS